MFQASGCDHVSCCSTWNSFDGFHLLNSTILFDQNANFYGTLIKQNSFFIQATDDAAG